MKVLECVLREMRREKSRLVSRKEGFGACGCLGQVRYEKSRSTRRNEGLRVCFGRNASRKVEISAEK